MFPSLPICEFLLRTLVFELVILGNTQNTIARSYGTFVVPENICEPQKRPTRIPVIGSLFTSSGLGLAYSPPTHRMVWWSSPEPSSEQGFIGNGKQGVSVSSLVGI